MESEIIEFGDENAEFRYYARKSAYFQAYADYVDGKWNNETSFGDMVNLAAIYAQSKLDRERELVEFLESLKSGGGHGALR